MFHSSLQTLLNYDMSGLRVKQRITHSAVIPPIRESTNEVSDVDQVCDVFVELIVDFHVEPPVRMDDSKPQQVARHEYVGIDSLDSELLVKVLYGVSHDGVF